jgi:hypothetical protein
MIQGVSGEELKAAREAAGIGLSAMARRVSFTPGHLSNIEAGRRASTAALITTYEELTGLHGPPDPLRVGHEWLVSEFPQTLEIRAGRMVGAGSVTQLEARVIELRHLDDHLGGEDLAPVVTKELDETSGLVREASYTEPIGRRLLTSVGELAQLAGWVASDAGKHRDAERLYLSGVDTATEAGDRPLAANLLSSPSYQIANVGKPADALLLARTAVKGSKAEGTVRALLLERVAWAAAKARDANAALRALDWVDDAYEDRHPESDPEWVYWLNRDEISTMRARVMVELGKPADAGPILADVLSRYPANSYREQSLYWSWLAEAYARADDRDQAQEALLKAASYASLVNSPRADERIKSVGSLLRG